MTEKTPPSVKEENSAVSKPSGSKTKEENVKTVDAITEGTDSLLAGQRKTTMYVVAAAMGLIICVVIRRCCLRKKRAATLKMKNDK